MILQHLTLSNFGAYGGEIAFDLTPIGAATERRPVTLIYGKNGVGKTTLMEAVRLCLHGRLGLGQRMSRSEYHEHLLRRIHRPRTPAPKPCGASIRLQFQYVRAGRPVQYDVRRFWQNNKGKITEEVIIHEDGAPITEPDSEQIELILRELVTPGAADVFFFDGEKLDMLASEARGGSILADTIKAMLGLNVVDRLQKDLNSYLLREAGRGLQNDSEHLANLSMRLSELEGERERLSSGMEENEQEITCLKASIARQEEHLAQEGNLFALRRDELKDTHLRLIHEVDSQKKQIQDLCSGLAPFALASQVGQSVLTRLEQERQYEQWETSQELVKRQLEELTARTSDPLFWSKLGTPLGQGFRDQILKQVTSVLEHAIPHPDVSDSDIILHNSEQERHRLTAWISTAVTEIPDQFRRDVQRLGDLEDQLQDVEADLLKVPSEQVLRPYIEELNKLNQKLGALLATGENLSENLRLLQFHVDQTTCKLRDAQRELAEQSQSSSRLAMVTRTQDLLADYTAELTRIRIRQIEKAVVDRFNDLCRKDNLVERAEIHPETFTLTLYHEDHSFERNELSAGEQQLLAIALVWAIRQVSGVPMPVILDTPVGRLDTDHRRSMVQTFLPQASHQVIVLATDAEIDQPMLEELRPSLSHIYDVKYDPIRGLTECTVEHPGKKPAHQVEVMIA